MERERTLIGPRSRAEKTVLENDAAAVALVAVDIAEVSYRLEMFESESRAFEVRPVLHLQQNETCFFEYWEFFKCVYIRFDKVEVHISRSNNSIIYLEATIAKLDAAVAASFEIRSTIFFGKIDISCSPMTDRSAVCVSGAIIHILQFL